MSLDFTGSASTHVPHGMYGQGDLDSLQSVEGASHYHMGGGLHHNGFDHADSLDVPEHPGFDIFSNSQTNNFGSQRYRTNASSSSSLGPNYSIGGDPTYSHSYADPVPPFSGGNPYDMGHGLQSSYSSGKVSPLTPSDPMQQASLFSSQNGISGGGKEFAPQNGYSNLLLDRRTSHMSNTSYGSDYPEEFAMGGANNNHNGMSYPLPPIQQYQERRFQHEQRYSHPSGSSAVPSHMHHNHGPDVLRSVAPQSTHHYQSDITGFDELHPYIGPGPTGDLSLRMPSVDETLARMKLQGQASMGGSNDLHTFIRSVYDYIVCAYCLQ